jgi:serine/threonine protein phosphatase PrpC
VAEANSNIGSASHLGEKQVVRDSHFVYDYSRRRVPLPIVSYMAVADAAGEIPPGENPAKKALDMLRDLVEPAVIAEEELETGHMEELIRGALSSINRALLSTEAQPASPVQVSLTVVVADARRAYIGHVGNTRVYLLHNDRLYDLVPSGASRSSGPPPPPPDVAPTLFPVAEGAAEAAAPVTSPPAVSAQAPDLQAEPVQSSGIQPAGGGSFLGQSAEVNAGFNQVDIIRGDTVILCTDGLWRSITEEELVENLLSALSVQRSANQLVRLAFSRDPSDNATMVAWQYGAGDDAEAAAVPGRAGRRGRTGGRRRARAAEGLLIALLTLVLVGIFAVGFAFGWRITDTFRKPAKEAAKKTSAKKAAEEKKAEEEKAAQQSAPGAESSAPGTSFPKAATVSGQGVRMRATPDTNGELIGLLRDGQQVTVLGEAMGTDSKTWSRVKAVVTSGGQEKESEGYVRNDFLTVSQQAGASGTSAP